MSTLRDEIIDILDGIDESDGKIRNLADAILAIIDRERAAERERRAKVAAAAAVDAIFEDLRDRMFLKWVFAKRPTRIGFLQNGEALQSLDQDVQGEIRIAWADLIAAAIRTTPPAEVEGGRDNG